MKYLNIIIPIGVILFFTLFVFIGGRGDSDHVTLNESAILPDKYLENVAYYEKMERYDRSAVSLERAIKSIGKLQDDVDDQSFAMLEEVVLRLVKLQSSIERDSIHLNEMRGEFNHALATLAHAELELAEMYAETNHLNEADIALKYAQLHIKNAMLYHDPFWKSDQESMAVEQHIFDEMDSLLANEAVTVVEYAFAVDKMIKEVDELIAKQVDHY